VKSGFKGTEKNTAPGRGMKRGWGGGKKAFKCRPVDPTDTPPQRGANKEKKTLGPRGKNRNSGGR